MILRRSLRPLLCAGLTLAASAATPQDDALLDARDCKLIADFNRSQPISFVDHFANMVHRVEYCAKTGGVCEVPLQKRLEEYYFIRRGHQEFPTSEIAKAADDALIKTLTKVESATGVRIRFEKPSRARNFLFMVFINEDVLEMDRASFIEARISNTALYSHEQTRQNVQNYFNYFMKSSLPCAVVSKIPTDDINRRASIWIKADIDAPMMRRCIAEEIYNSMGLDEGDEVASIFDYDFSHAPGDTELSEFDLLLLRLLYADDLKPEMEKPETKRVTQQIVARWCGPAHQP